MMPNAHAGDPPKDCLTDFSLYMFKRGDSKHKKTLSDGMNLYKEPLGC